MAKKINLPDSDAEPPLVLLEALSKLFLHYTPVSCPEFCDEHITTKEIFQKLQNFYPSEEYTMQTVAELLSLEGWTMYYNPVIEDYFWQVKKISSDL